MKVDLVRIGNSRGIRIPKPIIEHCGFGDTVELRVERDTLVVSSPRRPRQGWREAFQQAAKLEKDELLLSPLRNKFDDNEWEW